MQEVGEWVGWGGVGGEQWVAQLGGVVWGGVGEGEEAISIEE